MGGAADEVPLHLAALRPGREVLPGDSPREAGAIRDQGGRRRAQAQGRRACDESPGDPYGALTSDEDRDCGPQYAASASGPAATTTTTTTTSAAALGRPTRDAGHQPREARVRLIGSCGQRERPRLLNLL